MGLLYGGFRRPSRYGFSGYPKDHISGLKSHMMRKATKFARVVVAGEWGWRLGEMGVCSVGVKGWVGSGEGAWVRVQACMGRGCMTYAYRADPANKAILLLKKILNIEVAYVILCSWRLTPTAARPFPGDSWSLLCSTS